MKFLLIRPPFAVEKFYFPRPINESLGIESLEAFLSPIHKIETIDSIGEGWNHFWESTNYPDIIFQGLKPNNLFKKISDFSPDVIGLTWLFSTQNSSIDLTIKTIRKFNQTIPIIVGGPQPSANIKETFEENPEIDIIVYGEGEITLKEILDNQLKNLEKINGIAYREADKIKINPPRPLIENLDILPIPKRHQRYHQNYSKQYLYQAFYSRIEKFKFKPQFNRSITAKLGSLPFVDKLYYQLYNWRNNKSLPMADIVTSRGCPNHCTFCAIHNIWGHSWRMRSAENVLEEIEQLVNQFGIRHINFQDDNFNVLKKRTIEICKGIIKNNYNITLLAPAGAFVPTLDEEVLTWLKKAGLNSLRMSIESGNQNILNNVIKKNINLSKIKGIVDICKKLKIYTEGAFIFGIPGETKETMLESLKFAKNAGFDRIVKFIFQPFPNTELYRLCVEKGYLTADYDPQKAYITGNHCYVKTGQFSPTDVLKVVNRS